MCLVFQAHLQPWGAIGLITADGLLLGRQGARAARPWPDMAAVQVGVGWGWSRAVHSQMSEQLASMAKQPLCTQSSLPGRGQAGSACTPRA